MDKVVYYTCFRTIKRPKLKPRPFLCFLEPTLHGRSRCFALHFSASDDFENHPVAVENQHSVSAGIAAFGSVLCFAFGSDADTAEACGLGSRSDQRQVAALGGAAHARNRRLDAAHVFDAIFHGCLAIKNCVTSCSAFHASRRAFPLPNSTQLNSTVL